MHACVCVCMRACVCECVEVYNDVISHTFDQEICLKFATCDLYCGCEKRGALPSISRMRVAACSSLGATGGSMVTRRCS